MISKLNITRRREWRHNLRSFKHWRVWFSLILGSVLLTTASGLTVHLKDLDGGALSPSAQWAIVGHGYPTNWYGSGGIMSTDVHHNLTADYTFYFRGQDAYWYEGQYAMPFETNIVNPSTNILTFTFPRYTNTLSVVTTGVLTSVDAPWSFTSPSALLTNSSSYQAQYTNQHLGDGAPVSTTLSSLPTGNVTVVFGALTGYVKPSNETLTLAGASPQTITGVYTRQYGDLYILPRNNGEDAPFNPQWSISGPADYDGPTSGFGATNIFQAPIGEYTVVFHPVSRYDSPDPQIVTKTNNISLPTEFEGVYTLEKRQIRINLRDKANPTIMLQGSEWNMTRYGFLTSTVWHEPGEWYEYPNIPDDYVFRFRGKDVYWPESVTTNISDPSSYFTANFDFDKYSNNLAVVTAGILTDTDVSWHFRQPSALLTNSSAYQAGYVNTHYYEGSGSPVSSPLINPLPTGTVTIVFSDVFGYKTPENITTNLISLVTSVTGAYERLYGDLHILPRDPLDKADQLGINFQWEITSFPRDYTGPTTGAGETNITQAPLGLYTVHFLDAQYYASPVPASVSKTNRSDAVTDYIGTYSLTGRKLTLHVVLPGETNATWNVGSGLIDRSLPGLQGNPDEFYYIDGDEVTLTALPADIVKGGITYQSFFFEWFGYTNANIPSGTSPGTPEAIKANPITFKMNQDRHITLLFSHEKYPWDNAGDLDNDGLPDEWEIAWKLDPKSSATVNGAAGNPDGDWIPATSVFPAALVSVRDDSLEKDPISAGGIYRARYVGVGGTAGYPLLRSRLLTPQSLGVGERTGYAGGVPFHNLLECRGFDGFYKTNGGHLDANSPGGYVAYTVPDDDPGTDPLDNDTDSDGLTDGWEYYFWYWRSADAFNRGITNSANLSWVTIHPTWPTDSSFDMDGDGLSDSREYTLGTDPTHADTDGDGMDDWWELQYDLNPLDYADASANTDGDFMAVRRDMGVLQMTNGITDTVYGTPFTHNVYDTDDMGTWVDVNNDGVFTLYSDIVLETEGSGLQNGVAGNLLPDVYFGMQAGLPAYLPGYPVWIDVDGDGIYTDGVDIPIVNPAIKHELVYMAPPPLSPEGSPGETSFSPFTAWRAGDAFTEAYNAYQEYLGGGYFGRVSWDAGGRVIAEHDDPVSPSRVASTSPVLEDTDGDGIPDGWELYVGLNPNSASDASKDPDKDDLSNLEEWANTTHPLSQSLAWATKNLPTDPGVITAPAPNDPHPADTDWDGLTDGEEKRFLTCPTSVDTDRDGLPDGWEVFAGTDPLRPDANEDSDQDGLLNWQEYWTGTVPEWQYCDTAWDLRFLSRELMSWEANRLPILWSGVTTFLSPDFLTCPSFMYANGVISDLEYLREEFPAAKSLGWRHYKTTYAGTNLVVESDLHGQSIDPRDSDGDGMDDFWEVFHCLNPLVGLSTKIDIARPEEEVYMPLAGVVDAAPNRQGYQVGLPGDPFLRPMDLIEYFVNVRELEVDDIARFNMVRALVGPHYFGCVNNDPDGDGLSNFQEYTYYRNAHLHTCPVPLWRTDPYATGPYSFIAGNYRGEEHGWSKYGFGGITYSESRGSIPFRWAAMAEGFDTDGDLSGDYHETTGYNTNGIVAATDPLDDQSPLRNRVLKLDGVNSWGRSYAWSHYGDFSKFTVEAWVRPARLGTPQDQVIAEKASAYTVETASGVETVALANFQLGIGADGVPYILFHGISGYTTQRASASSLAGQLRENQWVHLAGVFNGSQLTLYVNGDAAATHRTTDVPARGIEGNYDAWHPNCSLSVGARETVCGWHFPRIPEKFFAGEIDELRVWDRALPQAEIILRKDRELTKEEIGEVLPGNSPYQKSVGDLFAYYTFNSLPDPEIEGIAPSDFPAAQRPALSTAYSEVYTNNYLVIAADRVKRIPRWPALDTRVINSVPIADDAEPDTYGISTRNYLDINLPSDFRNSSNPYNFTHAAYNIDMGRGLWMCGKAQGKKPDATWLQVTDPDDADSIDSDGDGLPDWWEILYGLDPHDATGDNGRWGDPDGDGLSNWAEYMAGTNPMKWDSTDDGLSDYYSRSDSDPYALTWGELYDDGDWMPDAWEAYHGLDPNKDDAFLDNDNDGWSNYAEFLAGTDPSSPDSRPNPAVRGSLIYNGSRSGQYHIWGYQNSAMDGAPVARQIGLDSSVSEVITYSAGSRTITGRLPYAPVQSGSTARFIARVYQWDGVNVSYRNQIFTFTGPNTFTYQGGGSGAEGSLNYTTGEYSLTWPSSTVPPEGTEIRAEYVYNDPHNSRFSISGFNEGPVYLLAFKDVNGNGEWDAGEPFGVAHGQPFNLGVSDIKGVRIYLHEELPGYRRFKWNLASASDTNTVTHVLVNYTSMSGAPQHFDIPIRTTRNFFHEWDCQRFGYYGMPTGSYRWWAGTQNGTFYLNWNLPGRPYAVAPRGNTFYTNRNQIEWAMDQEATMYHLQVARKESDGRLTMVEDKFYPAPGQDPDGYCRDYLRAYASDWGNGAYFWRVAGWNPAGHGPWSGDDVGSVQSFHINLNSEYSRSISGTIYYFGKAAATNIVLEVFDNLGFSGIPEARIRLKTQFNPNPNKEIPFTVKGLPEGVYYVRAFIDTVPFGGSASGKWETWKTQGIITDNNNMYRPGAQVLLNTRQITGKKLVLRDRDTDNDRLPDAWEVEYFGNLNQTGDTDFDGDGESNYDEYRYTFGILNPRLLDTDGDGLSDSFEMRYNPARYGYPKHSGAPLLNPSLWDTDGDGYSDGAELLRYHTDPLDPTSFPYYRPPCYGPSPSPADIDGDGRSDLVLHDPAKGQWHVYTMAGEQAEFSFGDMSMTPLLGDFDGDGYCDFGLYRVSSGLWKLLSITGDSMELPSGMANMIPVPGDYDGDLSIEMAMYDGASGTWYIYPYEGRLVTAKHGGPGQIPVPGDYDGDGKTDLAVYNPANGVWSIKTLSGQSSNIQWGSPDDIPVPGDYYGNGQADLAVFNTKTGFWRVLNLATGEYMEGQFGRAGVIPAPGDYDGDGRTDVAYYDPVTRMWHVYTMSGELLQGQYGPPGAIPVLGWR